MKKAELIAAVAKKAGYYETSVEEILATTFSVMREAILQGEKVTFYGIGSVRIRAAATRKARDFRNGGFMVVPPKLKLGFAPSKKLEAELQERGKKNG